MATEPEVPKEKAVSNPLKDMLDCRMKKVEIIGKIEDIRSSKIMDELTIQRMKLENKDLEKRGSGFNSPIEILLGAARAWCIDNDKTVLGSEPVLRSLWEAHELEEIKDRIMAKLRKL